MSRYTTRSFDDLLSDMLRSPLSDVCKVRRFLAKPYHAKTTLHGFLHNNVLCNRSNMGFQQNSNQRYPGNQFSITSAVLIEARGAVSRPH